MISLSQRSVRKLENWLVVPLAVVAGLVIAYWAIVADRIPPLVLTEGEIITKAAHRLEPITARWRVDRTRNVAYSQTCERHVIDSLGTFHRVDEQEITNTAPPLADYIARSVNIPVGASWGPAYYRQQCCYEIEGLSLTRLFPICVRRPELPFEVLPNK